MTTKGQDMKTHARNPVALITGGNRGLGRSMAVHLAEQGVGVVLTYRGSADEAAAVVKEVEARGAKGAALALDVTETHGFPTFAEALKAELARQFDRDRFDFLVNNAGFGLHASFAETTEAQLDALFNVHFKGPFLLTQTLLPLLADGGRILNVSTGLARFTLPGYSAYAAMKGAIEVLTRYQAKELGARGITVNTLAPGAIATDFGGGVVRDNPEVNRFVASQTALGRVGRPEDVGAAVALLLSPGGGWVNGQRIEVSGGQSL
jgi:NAD(P)-dependent dehydrogenase (short-subunit alcohol dehydrogenase family)